MRKLANPAGDRNARRGDLDLVDTYGHVDAVVRAHDRAGLITGIFGELNEVSGLLRAISARHPGGFIIRDGAVVKTLPTPTALPVSMSDLPAPEVVEEALQPGDHVLLYTDGDTNARTEGGEFFGVDRLVAFVVRAMADGLLTGERRTPSRGGVPPAVDPAGERSGGVVDQRCFECVEDQPLSVDVMPHARAGVVVVLDPLRAGPAGTQSTLHPLAEATSQVRRSRRDLRQR